jgi:hypothetical protein
MQKYIEFRRARRRGSGGAYREGVDSSCSPSSVSILLGIVATLLENMADGENRAEEERLARNTAGVAFFSEGEPQNPTDSAHPS